nr:conserved D6/D11-like helicase [Marseillevirus cajuinensis]
MENVKGLKKKYKISEGSMTMEELCSPKKFTLQPPQLFIQEYMGPKTGHNKILLFHGLGSGKTCEAIRIAETNMGSKTKKKTLVLLAASLEANFVGELMSECGGEFYVKDKDRKLIRENPESSKAKKVVSEAKKKISKRYDVMSYQKFYLDSKKGKIDMGDYGLLVIDEVQNILGKLWYEALMKELETSPKDLKIVLLSATPIFDDEIEIAKTLNILKFRDDPFVLGSFKKRYLKYEPGTSDVVAGNMDEFKERIKGLVSYVRGADPKAYPKVDEPKVLLCKMSEFQGKAYEKYETAPKELRKKNLEYNNSIYKAERQAANLVYPNGSCGSSGQRSETPGMWKMPKLGKYSCKFATLLKKLEQEPAPAFVYSNFVNYGGAASIAQALEANGFAKYGTKSKKPKYALFTGDETKEERERVVKAFNREKNSDGSVIQVMIGSKSIAEGVTLKRVRQVHIIDPFFNQATISQAIGRAVRFCSHKDLPEKERVVKVWLYRARRPDGGKTVDDKIYDEIVQPKAKVAEGFLLALKEAAVDCELFKDKGVKCFKPKKDFVVPFEAVAPELARKSLPRLLFKKQETKVSGSEQLKKKFLDELRKGIHEGVRVSWNTNVETEEIGKRRKKAVESWLKSNGLSSVPVRVQEMSSSSASIERPPKSPSGKRAKTIPRGKNPYPGCPAGRRPFDKKGKESCEEGSEIRPMKSGVKCCYKKGRGAPRKKLGTSLGTPQKGSENLIDAQECMKYTLAELKDIAKKVGIPSSGTKEKICIRLAEWASV